MAHSDVFALKNSDLNAFLFADVGTELNGSALTILSVLARLGQDPWAEAARWAKLPKAAVIDCLAQSITRMPLSPQALARAGATAARLALLLPGQTRASGQSTKAKSGTFPVPKWARAVAICGALVLGLAVNVILTPRPAVTALSTVPTVQQSP